MENINGTPIDILLVEDNEPDIKITQRAFQKAKVKNNLFIARNGQEALDFVRHEGAYQDKNQFPTPDLILLDIQMPKLNGFQVLEVLKGDEHYKYIPIIMLTSSKNEKDILQSYGYGAASYIQKPVVFEEFIQVVDGFNFYWHIINKLPHKK